MSRYEGLDKRLKLQVFERDNWRCRWCGSTNRPGYDAHHIRYRRGTSDDVLDNLITLCRTHHDFVHDSYLIPKARAQEILWYLASPEGAGQTGMALFLRPGPDVEGTKIGGRLLVGQHRPFRLVQSEQSL